MLRTKMNATCGAPLNQKGEADTDAQNEDWEEGGEDTV